MLLCAAGGVVFGGKELLRTGHTTTKNGGLGGGLAISRSIQPFDSVFFVVLAAAAMLLAELNAANEVSVGINWPRSGEQ